MNRALAIEIYARDLIEQIDLLEGMEFSRDVPEHEACFDFALVRLRRLLEPQDAVMTDQDYREQQAEWAADEDRARA